MTKITIDRVVVEQVLETLNRISASSHYDTYTETSNLEAALAEDALQRLTDVHQDIEATHNIK